MKCRRCRAPAVIDVRRHNAGFCADCFTRHCREQVWRAIEDHALMTSLKKPPHHVRPHSAQTDHSQLHDCLRFKMNGCD